MSDISRVMNGESMNNDFLSANLTDNEMNQFIKGIKRHGEIGQLAKKLNIMLLVDAEYTYMNPLINTVGLALMFLFNRSVRHKTNSMMKSTARHKSNANYGNLVYD